MDIITHTNALPSSPAAIVRSSDSLQEHRLPPLSEITGFAKLSTMNRWASDAGFVIGEGPVTQGVVGFNLNKLSGFIWGNLDHNRGLTEVDLGVSYTVLKREVGAGTLSLTLGGQLWAYPKAAPTPNADADLFATATLTWKGPITVTADYKHHFAGLSTDHGGELLVFKIGREQELYSSKERGSLTLDISTQAPIRYNFFVNDGLSLPCVRPGVALKWQDPDGRFGLTLDTRYQIGIDGRAKDQLVFGASLSYAF
jgi:hypothetical protein